MLISENNCLADGKSASDASSAVRRAVVEELQNDPTGKGYAAMTATEVAASLMEGEPSRWVTITVGLAYASNAVDAFDISTIRGGM